LWWGHRIPVWYIVGKKCEEDYIVARTEEEALAKAQEKYGKSVEIYQDPDVLDTWFSRSVFLCEFCGPIFFSVLCISLLPDYIFYLCGFFGGGVQEFLSRSPIFGTKHQLYKHISCKF
jgi:hypothetical protein